MGREQRKHAQLSAQRVVAHLKPRTDDQHRPMRIGADVFHDAIAAVRRRVGEPVKQTVAVAGRTFIRMRSKMRRAPNAG